MFHALHVAVLHAHVGHGAYGALAAFGDWRAHAFPGRERAACEAAAVHRFGEDRIGAFLLRLDDYVVGLGDGDAELVHRDGLHVLTVGLHHGHRQARDTDVEEGAGAGVDEAQAHALAGAKQPGPVIAGRQAVHQVGVRCARDVGDVGGIHAHPSPTEPVPERVAEPFFPGLFEQAHQGASLVVIVTRHFAQFPEHVMRVFEGPVSEYDHIFPVVGLRLVSGGVDDDGPVNAGLLLKAAVAVVPVRAGLPDREAIDERLAGLDAGKTDAGHAVHIEGQDDAVPVDGRVLLQGVRNPQDGFFAFAEAEERAGDGAVDSRRRGLSTVDVQRDLADRQVVGRRSSRETTAHGYFGVWPGIGGEKVVHPRHQAHRDRRAEERTSRYGRLFLRHGDDAVRF